MANRSTCRSISMSHEPSQTPLEIEKQKLEIYKLRTDIVFIKLKFIAQIINTTAIGSLGFVGFLYFQRPQIDQMESTRLANERQQIGLALERAISIENSQQRMVSFKVLKELWPQYRAIQVAEEARNLLDIRTGPVDARENCGQALANIAQLEKGGQGLEAALAVEISGGGGTRPAGYGAIAHALQAQLSDLRSKILQARKQASFCF